MSINVFEYETNKLTSTLEDYLNGQSQLDQRCSMNDELNDSENRLMSFRSPSDISNWQVASNENSSCLRIRSAADPLLLSSDILSNESDFGAYAESYIPKQHPGLESTVYNLPCYSSGIGNDSIYCNGNPFVVNYDRYPTFSISASDKNDDEFLDSRQQAGLSGMGSIFDSIGRSSVRRRPSTCNRKERRRTHSINAAFSALRNCIPNVPSDTKLSKIKTLRLATSYIAFLMNVLDKNDPKLVEAGFKADMSSRRNENRDEKRRREAQEILKASVRTSEKPSKGRTGWPQQVWASELNQ